jgi:hypothetical protein
VFDQLAGERRAAAGRLELGDANARLVELCGEGRLGGRMVWHVSPREHPPRGLATTHRVLHTQFERPRNRLPAL